MVKPLVLKCGDITLEFVLVDGTQWCRIYLHNQKDVFLGAEVYERIRDRLVSALKKKNIEENRVPSSKGPDVSWVLTLFEQHARIYSEINSGDHVILRCVDDECRLIQRIDLTPQDTKIWIDSLKKFGNYNT